MEKQVDWYEKWFDSPYYHLLYHRRDSSEAELLLSKLIDFFQMNPGSRVLDIACGKGRHSMFLASRGFDVTGFDLSQSSIQHNLDFETDRLHFYVHDMRHVFRVNYFDYAFNLFSSFGYFNRTEEDIAAIKSAYTSLKPGGLFIFDYANGDWIRQLPMESANDMVNGIQFQTEKFIDEPFVIKRILVTDKDLKQNFEERLRLFNHLELQQLFTAAGFEITHLFGSYELTPFDPSESPRIIIAATKK